MLSLPSSVRIYFYTRPADMRRGYDGLASLAAEAMGQDPLSGHLFVFANRRRDRVKVLYWDRDGFAIWAKRLEKGCFRFPAEEETSLQMTPAELAMVLGGVELAKTKRLPRYSPPLLPAS